MGTSEAPSAIRLRLVCGAVYNDKRCAAPLLRVHGTNIGLIVESLECPRCGAANEFRWGMEGVSATTAAKRAGPHDRG